MGTDCLVIVVCLRGACETLSFLLVLLILSFELYGGFCCFFVKKRRCAFSLASPFFHRAELPVRREVNRWATCAHIRTSYAYCSADPRVARHASGLSIGCSASDAPSCLRTPVSRKEHGNTAARHRRSSPVQWLAALSSWQKGRFQKKITSQKKYCFLRQKLENWRTCIYIYICGASSGIPVALVAASPAPAR